MNLDEKLSKLNELVELANIKELESKYTLSDGTLFDKKMLLDLMMWKKFEEEYGIDKIGLIKLRDILGNPEDFKQKYI